MYLYRKNAYFLLLLSWTCVFVSGDVVSELSETGEVRTPVLKPVGDPLPSLNLLTADNDYSDISPYCKDLLDSFGKQCADFVNCSVPAARPVKLCENCFASYEMLSNIYTNISSDKQGPGGQSCRDSLLRSDRLMLVFLLFSNFKEIWDNANCQQCISGDNSSLTNDTLYFLNILNQTNTCFDQNQQGNQSYVCKTCKKIYKELNTLYSDMETNKTLCMDTEDAINMTRHRWSRTFNCSLHGEEQVPIIAVSIFMLFLPIIFYLSSFLHSEQKKRKLINPKRVKSYSSLMNIQDKLS